MRDAAVAARGKRLAALDHHGLLEEVRAERRRERAAQRAARRQAGEEIPRRELVGDDLEAQLDDLRDAFLGGRLEDLPGLAWQLQRTVHDLLQEAGAGAVSDLGLHEALAQLGNADEAVRAERELADQHLAARHQESARAHAAERDLALLRSEHAALRERHDALAGLVERARATARTKAQTP